MNPGTETNEGDVRLERGASGREELRMWEKAAGWQLVKPPFTGSTTRANRFLPDTVPPFTA